MNMQYHIRLVVLVVLQWPHPAGNNDQNANLPILRVKFVLSRKVDRYSVYSV